MSTKFCGKCGNSLNQGANFCPKCGWQVPSTSQEYNTYVEPPNTGITYYSQQNTGETSNIGSIVTIIISSIVIIVMTILLIITLK